MDRSSSTQNVTMTSPGRDRDVTYRVRHGSYETGPSACRANPMDDLLMSHRAASNPTNQSVPDYYSLLGVEPNASGEEIRRAFRRSVGLIHPDKFAHDRTLQAFAEEKLKKINAAMHVLSDPGRRRMYDGTVTELSAWSNPLTRRMARQPQAI